MDFISSNSAFDMHKDPAAVRYQREHISHWNRVALQKKNPRRPGAFYHKLLHHYFKFFIPPGRRVLELGCGHGDLLAAVKPSLGVGIDFSPEMIRTARQKHPQLVFLQADAHQLPIKGKFDVIILSDLVNDLWDVQHVLEQLQRLSHPETRLALNFYNNFWRLPLSVVKSLGLGADVLEQNWFAPNDLFNLLNLSGFEQVQHRQFILLPVPIPLISNLMNRVCVHFPPFNKYDFCYQIHSAQTL